MRSLFVVICFLGLVLSEAAAQNKYWVFFTDKDGVAFDPHSYFDQKAIDRRNREGIPLNHYTDRPVRSDYLSTIQSSVDSVTFASRWFNAAVCIASPEQIATIEHLPFIDRIESRQLTAAITELTGDTIENPHPTITDRNWVVLKGQTQRLGLEKFRKAGIDGAGMRIAIFDAGFPGVHVHAAFEHIRSRNGILQTWDFVKDREDVYRSNSHGTTVFSCIAGKIDSVPIGLATGADFLLARTESARENFAEEEYWLAAAEWADKNGADIINSSLGYTQQRYFPSDMDGKTSYVTRAANMAAGKGILVVNAAGNEGDIWWRTIGAPADADSVLTIGGISPFTGIHSTFSSYGPTRDMRIKPNLSAYGQVLAASTSGYGFTSGTSFASPLVAGFVACAWQSDTTRTRGELFELLQQAGDLHPYYDYAHGYGVPNPDKFLNSQIDQEPTFDFVVDDKSFSVEVRDAYLDTTYSPSLSMKQTAPSDGPYTNEVYVDWPQNVMLFHIENSDGTLDEYFTMAVHKKQVMRGYLPKFQIKAKRAPISLEGKKLTVWYRGYSETFELEK